MSTVIHPTLLALARATVVLAFLTGVGTPAASAQSAFWDPAVTSGGSWGTPSNWQGGVVPSGTGNSAGFILNFTPGASVTLDGNRTIGTVISAGANPWSLDAGTGGTLTAANFIVTGTGSLTVTAPLAGTNFTKDGSGTLVVTNPGGSYSGAININAGTLNLVGAGNYSTVSNVAHVRSGATLDVTQLTSGLRYGGDPSTRLAVNDGDLLTGTGTVKGGLKVKSGGTVYPGDNGVGSLSIDGKGRFETGSNWKVKLGTANAGTSNTNNRIDFTDALTLETGTVMPIDGSGLTFAPGQTYAYVIGTSQAAGFTLGTVTFQPFNFVPSQADASSFSLTTSGSDLILNFTPVPEPGTVLAVCLGAAAGCGALRGRRAKAERARAPAVGRG